MKKLLKRMMAVIVSVSLMLLIPIQTHADGYDWIDLNKPSKHTFKGTDCFWYYFIPDKTGIYTAEITTPDSILDDRPNLTITGKEKIYMEVSATYSDVKDPKVISEEPFSFNTHKSRVKVKLERNKEYEFMIWCIQDQDVPITTTIRCDSSKADNPITVKGKTVKVKYSKLKKKTQKIARSKAIKVKNAKGKVTYDKVSGNKKITINRKTGKITVKKKLKKGKYKLRVWVNVSGNSKYEEDSILTTVTIRVK